MQHQKNQIAVLVFAQSAIIDAGKKAIPNSKPIFEHLTHRVLDEVKKTDLPFFHFSEEDQIGTHFGERFANAIETIFKKGYHHIITIGNDSPLLKAKHILEAQKNLKKGKNVLGPSTDGGFYLMGIQQNQFFKQRFIDLPWQTSTLLSATQHYFDELFCEPCTLEYLTDIDSIKDAKKLFGAVRLLSKKFRYLLQSLFDKTGYVNVGAFLKITGFEYRSTSDLVRGSPC